MVVLFLYPLAEYIRSSIGYHDYMSIIADKQVKLLNKLITKRYRNKGYRVAWVLFCEKDNPEKFDFALIDSRVDIFPQDQLINAGVPFACNEKDWVYPDPGQIMAQLEGDLDSLRLGGFHRQDCVSKVAEYAYMKLGLGEKVIVDEDLTELFWFKARVAVDPKYQDKEDERLLNRLIFDREMTYEGFGYIAEPEWETNRLWQIIREERRHKPWFVHK